MAFNDLMKIDLPDAFPAEEYSEFMTAARRVLLPGKTDPWKEFGGATNLIAWRFRSCHEYLGAYAESWNKFRADVSFDEIYQRERALFGMFTCGVSCVESACYAFYALASHPSALGIRFGRIERYDSGPKALQTAIISYPRAKALVSALDKLMNADEWTEWTKLRNRMFHRSNLPRVIQGNVGGPAPAAKALQFAATSSTSALDADVSHLYDLFKWLSDSLKCLLTGASKLV